MSARRTIANLALFAVALSQIPQTNVQAGPLLEWLFGHRTAARPAYPVGQPIPVATAPAPLPSYAGNYGNYYGSMMPVIGPAGYGYRPAQPNGIVAATAPTIMSYVPDYRTSSYRAPVTYYRPIMTTDPKTGAQVVALAPCTSYEYQAQRIQTFGYNGLQGSFNTPPVQPAPQAMPTYTLPSGGVPLAANAPSALVPNNGTYSTGYGSYTTAIPYSSGASALTPSISSNYGSYPQTSGYSSNYGGYSALQPALSAPPTGAYPTAPYGSDSGYYGSPSSGGSCGNMAPALSAPGMVSPGGSYPGYTPGLVAPPSPTYQVAPTQVAPASPAVGNSNSYPVTPAPAGGVYPPASGASSDPNANVPPSLPAIGFPAPNSSAQLNRPQLRSIQRQPLTTDATQDSERSNLSSDALNRSQIPSMSPIPAPAELESQPRWNPGLLDEQDRTALRPVEPTPLMGQAKTIHWASFASESKVDSSAQSSSRLRAITPREPSHVDVQQPSPQAAPVRATLEFSKPVVPPQSQPTRSTGGWKSAR